jgi:hypothetical protein
MHRTDVLRNAAIWFRLREQSCCDPHPGECRLGKSSHPAPHSQPRTPPSRAAPLHLPRLRANSREHQPPISRQAGSVPLRSGRSFGPETRRQFGCNPITSRRSPSRTQAGYPFANRGTLGSPPGCATRFRSTSGNNRADVWQASPASPKTASIPRSQSCGRKRQSVSGWRRTSS